MKIVHNLLIVSAKVQDSAGLNFIVDTGVGSNIITDTTLANKLNFEKSDPITLFGGTSKKPVKAFKTRDIKFYLPCIESRNTLTYIINRDFLNLTEYLGIPIHGIIGFPFLSSFPLKLDYNQKYIKVYRREKYSPGWFSNKVNIDIIKRKPYVDALIDVNENTSIRINKLLIDLGASKSLLLNNKSQFIYPLPDKHIKSYLGTGIAGPFYGLIGRTSTLTFGDFSFNNVITSFPFDSAMTSGKVEDVPQSSLIGAEIMRRFDIWLDYKNKEMYLRKNTDFYDPFKFNWSGMEVQASENNINKLVVTQLRHNSPARDAGIKTGDIIISLNNYSGKSLNVDRVYKEITQKPGNTIKLKIKRGDEILKKKFELKALF